MDTFFNELSIKEAIDKTVAFQWMNDLLSVYSKARALGFSELKTTETFINSFLSPGYRVSDWMNDPNVSRDLRNFFKSKISKSPYIESLLEQKGDEKKQLYEFKYKGDKAAGLGAAYLFDSLAISFNNSEEWYPTIINLDITEYSEEDDRFKQYQGEVKHSSTLLHLEQLKKWIEEKKESTFPNGKILWLKRKEKFPHLVFCEATKDQLISLSPGQPEFHAVVNRLHELERYCANWNSNNFDAHNFPSKTTPESSSRSEKHKDKLTFTCPDGVPRFFSWHLRYTPGPGRIHFYPDHTQRKIYVGYIGAKIV